MSKLTKTQIDARRKRMQTEALKSVAKTEQLNIRIDESSINRLYAISAEQGRPVGTLVREWIIDRLIKEEQHSGGETMQLLVDLVSSLHERIDRWDSVMLPNKNTRMGENTETSYKTGLKKAGKRAGPAE